MTVDINKYKKFRREHPFIPAKSALAYAQHPDAREEWEASSRSDGVWTRTVEGFTITMTVEQESIYPIPDRQGNTDYGSYVDAINRDYNYNWQGNWPEPRVNAPLGLPYTSIHYSGPGWVQGEEPGYFIPDGIEEQFDYYRRSGQSKQVAWELTKQWVEDQLSMLFSSPLTNCVVIIKATKNGIELASTAMGTDVSGDDEGQDYLFEMVNEHDMITEVVEEAEEAIKNLTKETA